MSGFSLFVLLLLNLDLAIVLVPPYQLLDTYRYLYTTKVILKRITAIISKRASATKQWSGLQRALGKGPQMDNKGRLSDDVLEKERDV